VNIYSYFEPVGFRNQDELISLWKSNWISKGFNPILLSIEDAKKNRFFNYFSNEIKNLHLYITGRPIQRFGSSCYNRWMAYSSIKEPNSFLVADYDIFNINLTEEYIRSFSGEKMSFLNRYCPCAAITSPQQSLKFAQDIISFSQENKDKIRERYQLSDFVNYHDQEFLNLNGEYLQDKYIFEKQNHQIKLFTPNLDIENIKMLHFAHRSAKEFAQKMKIYNFEQEALRVEMIKFFFHKNDLTGE
jgi:hypothetical protein